ncbi:MAG TPA: RraA family protein [Acidimicrobiia bacterium]|nr:RraA family protein [Acidimicrobiia bacterium]
MTDNLNDVLDRVGTADLVDAMGRLHRHRCHLLDLVTPTPGRRLFGPAVTISYFPTCEAALAPTEYNFGTLYLEAVGEDPAGRVLVLAGNGHTDISLAGGTKLSRAHNMGLAGVMADGRLRDFETLAGFDFATYCRGEATKWGGDVVTPFQANVPVVVDGVGIRPGDYIHADSSGAVVIPAGQVEEVLEGAVAVVAEDAGYLEAIKNETPGDPPQDER